MNGFGGASKVMWQFPCSMHISFIRVLYLERFFGSRPRGFLFRRLYVYIYIYRHSYIYIYIYTHLDMHTHKQYNMIWYNMWYNKCSTCLLVTVHGLSLLAVGSHTFSSQNFKSRVSNPRAIAYFHFNRPFESSNLPGAGPIFPAWTLTTGRRAFPCFCHWGSPFFALDTSIKYQDHVQCFRKSGLPRVALFRIPRCYLSVRTSNHVCWMFSSSAL